jgi:F-type H+-transporting ATPase subunit b
VRVANKAWLATVLALAATPAFAQSAEQPNRASAEADRASRAAAGDSATPSGPGSEHHVEGGGPAEPAESAEAHGDPSRHFNFFGLTPFHLFDYIGKDEYGGVAGDSKMVDPVTQRVIQEEEPASPPFIFMLLNFALLLGLLAWKGRPVARKVAEERHDLIKAALDEAARLRKQAADKLAEYDARLKDADAEIKKLVDGMRVDAENDKKRILAAAAAQAAVMKRDAELRIAAEIELARAQLTREVTAATAAAAEKLLRETMTSGDQLNLVTAFITDVLQAGSEAKPPTPTARDTGRGDVR